MKLRIRENSLRLRLSKTDVEKFGENGRVSNEIYFGVSMAEKLSYSLEKSSDKKIRANFLNGNITVFVPQEFAKNWIETDEIGFEAEQVIDDNLRLRILVEKDFVCLSPRENEDESDNYSHPNQEQNC